MQPAAQPSMIEMFLPFIVIFVVFYFFIIRPQSKKMKAHEQFLANLKRGDEVITASGILATVEGLNDNYATVEIAPGVKVKILRKQITGSQQALAEQQRTDKK